MSLSCVTDKERVASILAWKEIHTASDLNLMVGGEIKSHGQRGGKQFFDDGYRSRELLAWSLPKLAPALRSPSPKAHAYPLAEHSATPRAALEISNRAHSFLSSFLPF
jgi:hypothetical protein